MPRFTCHYLTFTLSLLLLLLFSHAISRLLKLYTFSPHKNRKKCTTTVTISIVKEETHFFNYYLYPGGGIHAMTIHNI